MRDRYHHLPLLAQPLPGRIVPDHSGWRVTFSFDPAALAQEAAATIDPTTTSARYADLAQATLSTAHRGAHIAPECLTYPEFSPELSNAGRERHTPAFIVTVGAARPYRHLPANVGHH